MVLSWVIGQVAYLMSAFKLPAYDATVLLEKNQFAKVLENNVEIIRDINGVPHIYSKSVPDNCFGQGFCLAQERLWQMEAVRRVALGKISELLPEALPIDIFSRTLGFYRLGLLDIKVASPEAIKCLESYVNGINAYLESSVYSKPTEFVLAGFTPEYWKIEHVTAISRLVAFQLSRGFLHKIVNQALAESLGKSSDDSGLMDFLKLGDDQDGKDGFPPTLPSGVIELNDLNTDFIDKINKTIPQDQGSNSWAVSGNLTDSGKPVLAADPHLGISIPSVWYQIHIICDEFNCSGVSLVGMPFIQIGHNEHFAWGVTLSYADVADIFVEEFNTIDDSKYKFKGEWRDAQIIEEEINVKGQDKPYIERIRTTHHGPVVSNMLKLFSKEEQTKKEMNGLAKELTLSAIYLTESEELELDIFRRMNQIKNFEDFRACCGSIKLLSVNIIYADINGNIGYCMTGKIPLRTKEAIAVGNFPVPGSDGNHEWQGYIPASKMPCCKNPKQGYVVSCNHNIAGSKYEYYLGNSFKHGSRAKRITDMMNNILHKEKRKFTIEDHKKMQLDITDVHAQDIVEHLGVLENCDLSMLHTRSKHTDNISIELVQEVVRVMKTFDGYYSIDSVAATFHTLFRTHLIKALLERKIKNEKLIEMVMGCGLHEKLFVYSENHSKEIAIIQNLMRNAEQEGSLVQEFGGKSPLVWQALVDCIRYARSLIPSAQIGTSNVKEEVAQYKYGLLHQIEFKHALGVKIPAYNRGPYPCGGNAHTPNMSAYYPDGKSYKVSVYASWRMVVDMANVSKAEGIFAPGNSANLYSHHYDDNIEPFLKGEFHPMYWDRKEIEENKEGILMLVKKSP